MVPGEGFEPPAFGLQNRCTTTVLTRRNSLVFIRFRGFAPVSSPLDTGGLGRVYISSLSRSQRIAKRGAGRGE